MDKVVPLYDKSALYLREPVHIWCGSLLQHKEEESRHSKIKKKKKITTNACWLDMPITFYGCLNLCLTKSVVFFTQS